LVSIIKKYDPSITVEKCFFEVEVDEEKVEEPKATHLWEIRLGMLNLPIICCDEDVEYIDCTGFKLPMLKIIPKENQNKKDEQ